jgi:catechol 2,3-dioxygenase-like lactoylglutathione lyase family enzyme
MDFAEYRRRFFTDPPPAPRFAFTRIGGVGIACADLERAHAFYASVLGPPAYQEDDARGWRIGDTWLTLYPGGGTGASTIGFVIELATPAEAERLQRAFAHAGGTVTAPSDQLMYRPIRYCRVTDPFGTDITIIAPLP